MIDLKETKLKFKGTNVFCYCTKQTEKFCAYLSIYAAFNKAY